MVLISANAAHADQQSRQQTLPPVHGLAQGMDAVMARAKTDPAFAFDLLQLLASNHRSSTRSHTRTTSLLLQYLDKEGKLAYLTMLLTATPRPLVRLPRAHGRSPGPRLSRDAGQGEDEEGGARCCSKGCGAAAWAVESIYSLATRQRADLPVAVPRVFGAGCCSLFHRRKRAQEQGQAWGGRRGGCAIG